MVKQFVLAVLGYCILIGSLVAQNNNQRPTHSIELLKMNVLYVGVDNPIEVSVSGLSSAEYQVQSNVGTLKSNGIGHYTLRVDAPGQVEVTITTKDGNAKFVKQFRAKRIPDPTPALGAKFFHSDTLTASQFKAQMGIALLLQNFDFDVKCEMIEYKVTLISTYYDKKETYVRSVKNKGARFSKEALDFIYEAQTGDVFIFSEIKGRCPGDTKDRDLPPLVFFMGEKE